MVDSRYYIDSALSMFANLICAIYPTVQFVRMVKIPTFKSKVKQFHLVVWAVMLFINILSFISSIDRRGAFRLFSLEFQVYSVVTTAAMMIIAVVEWDIGVIKYALVIDGIERFDSRLELALKVSANVLYIIVSYVCAASMLSTDRVALYMGIIVLYLAIITWIDVLLLIASIFKL
jgi:hypothetical protein